MPLVRRTVAFVAVLLLASACASDGTAGSGDASCASVLEYDGRTYTGHGDLRYIPATTGVTGTGAYPPCNDGNGDDGIGAEKVTVAELRDLGPDRAVLANGTVFLAQGEPFPEQIRPWFSSPTCEVDGSFGVHGDWLAVNTSVKPRFDGDLRAPYRVTVRVTSADPRAERYAGWTIGIRVTQQTAPGLGPDDVKSSLWEGGSLSARVHCEGDRFVAEQIRSAPPA